MGYPDYGDGTEYALRLPINKIEFCLAGVRLERIYHEEQENRSCRLGNRANPDG